MRLIMNKKTVGLIVPMALSGALLTSCMLFYAGALAGTQAVRGIGVGALPQGYSEVGDFWITGRPDNTATITRYIGDNRDVRIPSEIEGVLITRIYGYQTALLGGGSRFTGAFQGGRLTSVTIPGSVASIGRLAFENNRLTSVSIGNGVISIGHQAFARNNLTSITIPNSVTTIEAEAFARNELTSVTIPNSVTSIGAEAFARNQLTNITIGNGVRSIGASAFTNNRRLTSVVIPFPTLTQADFAWGGTGWRTGINQNVIVLTP